SKEFTKSNLISILIISIYHIPGFIFAKEGNLFIRDLSLTFLIGTILSTLFVPVLLIFQSSLKAEILSIEAMGSFRKQARLYFEKGREFLLNFKNQRI
ncbi:MAG: hypothetical protein K8R21_09090, partial [Leptospira sp.]|nr:hypothetical protein [Leptospira sp.]